MWAGAAHLLLDPRLPAAELDGVLDAAGASALVAEPGADLVGSTILRLEPGGAPVAAPSGAAETPCYIAQRGTTVSHGAVVNQAGALSDGLGVSSADTVLVLCSMLFAGESTAVWAPLLAGARIVLLPAGLEHDGAEVSRRIAAAGATLVIATPRGWSGLIDSGLKATRGVRALSCGEPLPAELKEQILKRFRLLWNGFAVAETGGCATLSRVLPGEPVTIGRPLANTRAYVVDQQLRPVPVGVVGELIVAGAGVALGCVGDSTPATRSLIDDPFGPGRAVRTGERVRWRSSGELEWVAGSAVEQV
jgi:non-ribosomal peptide synthetase component F